MDRYIVQPSARGAARLRRLDEKTEILIVELGPYVRGSDDSQPERLRQDPAEQQRLAQALEASTTGTVDA